MNSFLSNRSAMVVDTGGQNVETAIRLANEFGRVYYCSNFHRGFDKLSEACPGMGIEGIEWVESQFVVQPDLYVYPDCSHMAEQIFLQEHGKRVWGSRNASWLEHKRKHFLEFVDKFGLQTPEYYVVEGLTALKFRLDSLGECFIKVSFWRGSAETHHHISMELSATWFANLERAFGPFVEEVTFVVIEPVDAVVENGYDGYCIDGQFPDKSLMGIETKDKSYIGTVCEWNDLPDDVRKVNEAFSPILKEYNYRNRWSTEIRVTEDGEFFFLDPTCRIPSPAGESQLANETNTGEIYWEGSTGNLVQPEYRKLFAAQVVIEYHYEMDEWNPDWRPVMVPDAVKDKVFLKYQCKVDDMHWIPPQQHDSIIGWVVGLGDTIQEAFDEVKDAAEQLDGQYLKISVESLADSLKAVQEQEKHGIEFTSQPVPEPSTVIDDA